MPSPWYLHNTVNGMPEGITNNTNVQIRLRREVSEGIEPSRTVPAGVYNWHDVGTTSIVQYRIMDEDVPWIGTPVPDAWYTHAVGHPLIFPKDTYIEIQTRNGDINKGRVREYNWGECGGGTIVRYKLAQQSEDNTVPKRDLKIVAKETLTILCGIKAGESYSLKTLENAIKNLLAALRED